MSWRPITRGEKLAQIQGQMIHCCGTDAWRGQLCAYHTGWAAGYDHLLREERGDRVVEEVEE